MLSIIKAKAVKFNSRLSRYIDNWRFLRENPQFIPVPKKLSADAYNHKSHRIYMEQGLSFARLIYGWMDELEICRDNMRILEWGCGPGRIIRHMPSLLQGYKPEIYASDYNSETISWCNKGIPEVSFHLNGLEPPLVFEDDFFDFVFVVSVFTHLSEKLHFAWLKELLRVTKPGGSIMFTTHGKMFVDKLSPEELELFNSGLIVERHGDNEGKKNFAAFHNKEYVRNVLLKDLEVLRHIEGDSLEHAGMIQDVWFVKK